MDKIKDKLKEDEFADTLISGAKAVAAKSPDDVKKIYEKNKPEIDAISAMLKDVKPLAAAAALDAKEPAEAANAANGAVGARQNGLRAAGNGVRAIGAMQPNNEPMAAANQAEAEAAAPNKGGRKRTKKTNYYRKRRGTRRRGSRRRGSSRRRRSRRN